MSVLTACEAAMGYGCVFARDPWSGRATIMFPERLPKKLLAALTARWADVEAILAEQTPPVTVAVSLAERLLTARTP
ncbi:MAG TPA: hypothetical protein VGI19_02765 [Candidatus Cybelea sp.]|jgi:hypothetical protein